MKLNNILNAAIFSLGAFAKEADSANDIAGVIIPEDSPYYDIDTNGDQSGSINWESIENKVYYARNLWTGFYQGLYGMGRDHNVEKPTEECFGPWIMTDLKKVTHFANVFVTDFWTVEYEHAKDAAYAVVDLHFLNDEYCHFRGVYWDLQSYCHPDDMESAPTCDLTTVLGNMQTQAFSVITQMSQVMALMNEEEEMDVDSMGYAFNQVGHAAGAIFGDLTGFNKVTKHKHF